MAVLLCAAACAPAEAQVVTRVDLDNDSFNFWQPPKRRDDREYTQGTRVVLLWPTSNPIARRLLRATQQCGTVPAERDCLMASLGLDQSIYTPNLDLRRRTDAERPFAGWLGVNVGVQRDRDRSLNAFSLMLGVTGKSSLAEPAQKWVHRTFGFRPPVGWDGQLPTELAGVVGYRGAYDVLRLRSESTGWRLIAAPTWSARAGTMATDATLGLQVTAGLRAPSPWQTAPNFRGDRWGIFVRAGATQAAVARNLFLDGSTFGQSPKVERNVLVGETELGVGLRAPIGMVEWRVHSRGREYKLQPRAHAYSTFAFSLR